MTPRKPETADQENKSMAKEMLMLERSTVRTGGNAGGEIQGNQMDPLDENSFFNSTLTLEKGVDHWTA